MKMLQHSPNAFLTAKNAWLRSPESYADLDAKVALLPVGFKYQKALRFEAGRGFFWEVRLGSTEAR